MNCKAVNVCGSTCSLLDAHLEEMSKDDTYFDTSCASYSREYSPIGICAYYAMQGRSQSEIEGAYGEGMARVSHYGKEVSGFSLRKRVKWNFLVVSGDRTFKIALKVRPF